MCSIYCTSYIYIYLEIYPKKYVFLHNPTDDTGINSCDIYSRTPSLSHHTVQLSQSIHCKATTNTVLRILILSNNNNSHFHLVQWVINGSSANNSFAHGWLAVAHIKPASPKEELKWKSFLRPAHSALQLQCGRNSRTLLSVFCVWLCLEHTSHIISS